MTSWIGTLHGEIIVVDTEGKKNIISNPSLFGYFIRLINVEYTIKVRSLISLSESPPSRVARISKRARAFRSLNYYCGKWRTNRSQQEENVSFL